MDKSVIQDAFNYNFAPTPKQVEAIEEIRLKATELAYSIVDNCPSCADRTSALRRVREAVMNANAAITLEGLI